MDGKVIDDPSELLEQFNTHFSKIADKLREKPDLNNHLPRLTNFVNSRKDHDSSVFWRELVLINLLLLTGLMHVDFVWLHQLSRWVLQGCWTTHSQLELFLNFGNPLKLPLCSKKEMQATHLTVISIKNYWTLRRRFFVWLFFEWTTWFTTSSPALFPRNNGRLLDLFRQSSFRKHHGSETAMFKNESWWAITKFGQQQSQWSTTCWLL